MRWTQSKFTKSLGISVIRIRGVILIVFGAISIFVKGSDPAALPAPVLAFAIIFVTGSVFFEARGRRLESYRGFIGSHLRRLI